MLAFDHVVIEGEGEPRDLSVREFLELPFRERARLVLQRRVRFYAGDDLVDRSIALQSLRESAVSA